MSKNLVIVESPAKAKTIEGYLGKEFKVMSSYGHVRDLAKKGLSIDLENSFTPSYEVSSDKKQVMSELKKMVKTSSIIWLATDEDREGEAISWHLYETLDLDKKETKRITFNEITKNAILKAIDNPREINMRLVDAQQARRVLDRIVGFELSPVLWRKVRPSLSAGRVQSVAVKLIVEREKEIRNFNQQSYFRLKGIFSAESGKLPSEYEIKIGSEEEVQEILKQCLNSDFSVFNIDKKPSKRTPAVPFTTSTLQQEASLKFGFSVSRTMSVAQSLYESGKITYMRTDSVNLSETALEGAKQTIIQNFGVEYSQVRKFKTKNSSAQEAHEAIRPTDFTKFSTNGSKDEINLYELIWKRSIASQMSDAKLEKTVVKIKGSQLSDCFVARGEQIQFDGFLKVYLESNLEDDDLEGDEDKRLLPRVEVNQQLERDYISCSERFTRPPSRYVEASLVKRLEELGIGRPSTYAPTISTIQKRGYVEKKKNEGEERNYRFYELTDNEIKSLTKTEITGKENNKLYPSDIGIVVTDFLDEHFKDIMDYQFTANVENEFDDIAKGKKVWTDMLQKFYHGFHSVIENTLEHSERATGERKLGVDPQSNREVIARIGKFGAMIQIGDEKVDGEKPKFASIPATSSIQTITLDEALALFNLPRILGTSGGVQIKANVGRFGPYVQMEKTFVSIPEEEDVMTINLTRAIELIEEKRKQDKNMIIQTFNEREDIQVLNGRYGPYIKIGKSNFKIPKGMDAQELTLQDCIEISESQNSKKSKKKK